MELGQGADWLQPCGAGRRDVCPEEDKVLRFLVPEQNLGRFLLLAGQLVQALDI